MSEMHEQGTTEEHTVSAELAAVLAAPGWALEFGTNDAELHDLYFYVWIVRSGRSVGIIDAGLPFDDAEAQSLGDTNQVFGDFSGFRRVRKLPEILAAAGVLPEEVGYVAITQTVTYHTGGIDADFLPNAVFYLARDGVFEFLADPPGHPDPEFYFSVSSWASLRTLAVEGRLRLVEEREGIVPGIVFEATGGHHPGSAGVLIDTPAGRIGILETAFINRNLVTGTPIGIAEDIAAARRAMRSFAERCDQVLAIHDASHETQFAAVEGGAR